MEQFARTEMLVGTEGMERLRRARVAVFGLGGVGGYVAEALARSGIGALELFDSDQVALTNLNRQIIALHSTIGQYKADAAAARLRDINPEAEIVPHRMFYLPEQAEEVDLSAFDYIADAVDTVAAKLELARRAYALQVPIISALGAGNRTDPTQLRVGDIFETQSCPLARVMRKELRKRGVPALQVVYSTEPALKPLRDASHEEEARTFGVPRRDTPGSMAFVPPVMGMIMASVIVRHLLAQE